MVLVIVAARSDDDEGPIYVVDGPAGGCPPSGRDLRRRRHYVVRGVAAGSSAQRSARMMRGHICVLNLAPIASSVLATAGVLAGFLGVTTYNLLPGGVFERGSARLAQVVRIMS